MSLKVSSLLEKDSKIADKNNLNKNNEINNQIKIKNNLIEENINRISNEAAKKFMDLIINTTIGKFEKGKRSSLLRKNNDNTRLSISNSRSNRISSSAVTQKTIEPQAVSENKNIKNNSNNQNNNLKNNKPLFDKDKDIENDKDKYFINQNNNINTNTKPNNDNNININSVKEVKNIPKKSVFILGNNTNSSKNIVFRNSLRRITHLIDKKLEDRLIQKKDSTTMEKHRKTNIGFQIEIIQEHLEERKLADIKSYSKNFMANIINKIINYHKVQLKNLAIKIQRIFRGHFYRIVFKIERLNLEIERENQKALQLRRTRKGNTLNNTTLISNKSNKGNVKNNKKDNSATNNTLKGNNNNYKGNKEDNGASGCFGVFNKK
jgi:hypothetical protein